MEETTQPQQVAPEPVSQPETQEAVDQPKTTPTTEPATKRETTYGPDEQIVIVTDKGQATRTTFKEFRVSNRGTKGSIAMYLGENQKNGNTVAVKKVKDGDLIFILTLKGQGALIPVDLIPLKGRGKAGVILMNIDEGDAVVSVA